MRGRNRLRPRRRRLRLGAARLAPGNAGLAAGSLALPRRRARARTTVRGRRRGDHARGRGLRRYRGRAGVRATRSGAGLTSARGSPRRRTFKSASFAACPSSANAFDGRGLPPPGASRTTARFPPRTHAHARGYPTPSTTKEARGLAAGAAMSSRAIGENLFQSM